MKTDGTIVITASYKLQGDAYHFRPHELCKRLRESLPKLFDRGQIDPDLYRGSVPVVPPPDSEERRPAGWDDFFVSLSYNVQLQ